MSRFPSTTLVFLAFAGGMVVASSPDTSGAAIVCQRKGKVTLRPGPQCKKKEQLAVDLGALANAADVSAAGATLNTRLDVVHGLLGIDCPGEPSRVLVPTAFTGTPPRLKVGCEQLDDDPVRCNQSFEFQNGSGTAASCFHYAHKCRRCRGTLEEAGACVDACRPPVCAGEAGRTYKGYFACASQTTQAACEASFETNDYGRASCRWVAATAQCIVCSQDDEKTAVCARLCDEPSRCPGRPGPPSSCGSARTQAECEQRWTDDVGAPTTCWWDGTGCSACYEHTQFLYKLCQNAC